MKLKLCVREIKSLMASDQADDMRLRLCVREIKSLTASDHQHQVVTRGSLTLETREQVLLL